MRITFTLIFLCCFAFAHAQIQRGDQIITLKVPTLLTEPAPLFNARDFGALFLAPGENVGTFDIGPTYGYALTDRLVVGGTINVEIAYFDNDWTGLLGVDPYLRYYLVNREAFGLYAQVSTDVGVIGGRVTDATIVNEGFYAFETANLRAGLQVPVASGVRMGPLLDYQIISGRNALLLGGQVELVLGAGGSPEASPVSAFRAGSVMLGGQLAQIAFKKYQTLGSLRVGGHYFLTDRLAAGLAVGAGGYRIGEQIVNKQLTLSADLSARYYLTTASRLVWYAEAGGGFLTGRQWSDDQFGTPTFKGDYFSVAIALGGQYFLRENIALEFGPQWRKTFEDVYTGKAVDVNFGARFFLR